MFTQETHAKFIIKEKKTKDFLKVRQNRFWMMSSPLVLEIMLYMNVLRQRKDTLKVPM